MSLAAIDPFRRRRPGSEGRREARTFYCRVRSGEGARAREDGHEHHTRGVLAKERGLNVQTGTCAVMHLKPGVSYHSLHKWINQALGKY
jgi:hypothetical protein